MPLSLARFNWEPESCHRDTDALSLYRPRRRRRESLMKGCIYERGEYIVLRLKFSRRHPEYHSPNFAKKVTGRLERALGVKMVRHSMWRDSEQPSFIVRSSDATSVNLGHALLRVMRRMRMPVRFIMYGNCDGDGEIWRRVKAELNDPACPTLEHHRKPELMGDLARLGDRGRAGALQFLRAIKLETKAPYVHFGPSISYLEFEPAQLDKWAPVVDDTVWYGTSDGAAWSHVAEFRGDLSYGGLVRPHGFTCECGQCLAEQLARRERCPRAA